MSLFAPTETSLGRTSRWARDVCQGGRHPALDANLVVMVARSVPAAIEAAGRRAPGGLAGNIAEPVRLEFEHRPREVIVRGAGAVEGAVRSWAEAITGAARAWPRNAPVAQPGSLNAGHWRDRCAVEAESITRFCDEGKRAAK